MKGTLFLACSVGLLCLAWWGRGREDTLRFVIPHDASPVLYATTFARQQAGDDWALQARRGGTVEVTQEALELTLDPQTPGRVRLLSTQRWLFEDFDLQADAAATDGPLNNSYGVVFRRLNENTYYLFYVSSDGYYSVWRETPEQIIKLSDWIQSDAVEQGTDGAVNALRVVARGDTFQFYVNGQPLSVCIPDDRSGESTMSGGECVAGQLQPSLMDDTIPYGAVGVAVETILEGGMAATFDNIVVMPVEAS